MVATRTIFLNAPVSLQTGVCSAHSAKRKAEASLYAHRILCKYMIGRSFLRYYWIWRTRTCRVGSLYVRPGTIPYSSTRSILSYPSSLFPHILYSSMQSMRLPSSLFPTLEETYVAYYLRWYGSQKRITVFIYYRYG